MIGNKRTPVEAHGLELTEIDVFNMELMTEYQYPLKDHVYIAPRFLAFENTVCSFNGEEKNCYVRHKPC